MKELKRIRKKKRLNQVQFAQLIGFSQSYISKVENGSEVPCINLIVKLRKEFKFNINKWVDNNE